MGSKTLNFVWEGLSALQIPAKVLDHCLDSSIDIYGQGIEDLPEPFNTASLWIFCRSAWPHSDPDFEGSVFITLAVQADHMYSQIIPNGQRIELGVFRGTLFVTDPLSLHWLAPNNDDTNSGFIGLQWEVPHHKLDEAWADLTTRLAALGEVRQLDAPRLDNVLAPIEDYEGDPPSPVF